MEVPGMSLFKGAASININNSAQDRLDEQEELEDRKRRDEELKQNLATAFDDFLDDDEASSVNSSGNFTIDNNKNNRNEVHQVKTGLPPTYIESLNHLNELQHGSETPKSHHETCTNQHPHFQHHNAVDEGYSPGYNSYGAGDGQNNYIYVKGHLNGINKFDARQEYINSEELKLMYEMRVKECQQMAGQIEKLDTEIDSLRARLGAAVNDRDKVEFSLKEAHHLLASSKHKLMELEQQVTVLTDKLLQSDQEKEQMKLEVHSANINLQDVQQRLHTMQVAHTHDTDALFREQQDRHREEMERMQNDFIKAKSRLDEKENEVRQLERRCKEKDKEKEEILIEKGATINRLATELEIAQKRLVSGETAKLKEKVSQLASERNTAREQVKELGSKLELTAHELVLCRNKLANNQKDYENWRTTLQQIIQESLPDNSYGSPSSPGKLATLKEILSRYKLQTHKLSSMQEEISKRDKKIEYHRKQETDLRSKLDEQKGLEMQLNSRLAVLQNKLELLGSNSDSDLLESYKQQNDRLQMELDEVRGELKTLDLKYAELELDHEKLKSEKGSRASIVQEANADLLRELERYSNQLKDTLKENGELKTLYLQACSTRDTANRELKDLQAKIQKGRELFKSQETELIERLEKEHQKVEKLSTDLTVSKDELERANQRISELQKEFTDKQKEFADKLNKYLEDEKSAMRKEIDPCTQCEKQSKHIRYLEDQISKFNIKLATQESNEELMKELKSKAEFFQQYIVDRFKKLQEKHNAATNTDEILINELSRHASSTESLTTTGNDELAMKTTLMEKEKAIRDQIAEKYTLEIKTMEMNCSRKIKEMESEHLSVVTKLKELLERKVKEVDTLKDFILAERSKVSQILEAKENEVSILIKEHNELHMECEKAKERCLELQSKAERNEEKVEQIDVMEDKFNKEIKHYKYIIKELEHELKTEREKFKKESSQMCSWKKVKYYKQKIQALESALKKEKESCQEKHNEMLEVKQALGKEIESYRERTTRLVQISPGTSSIQNTNAEWGQGLHATQAKIIQIQTKCEIAQKEHETIHRLYTSLEQQHHDLQEMYNKLQKEHQDLREMYTNLQKEYLNVKALQNNYSEEDHVFCDVKHKKLINEMQLLHEKYNNVKKTLMCYKDYQEKKDAHINNEINRVQDEYKCIIMKLQEKLNYYCNKKLQEEKRSNAKPNMQFNENREFQEQLEKLNDKFKIIKQAAHQAGFDGTPSAHSTKLL